MDPVRCTIKGVYVAVGAAGASPAVILNTGENRYLPIYIGLWEAISINNALNNELTPRPLTHDLFVEFLKKFDIRLLSLKIDSLEEGVYYATMLLQQDSVEASMDCRPSDGIALSVRCEAEILIDPAVVESSSVPFDELPRLVDLNSYFTG
jgi:bifunctional DNase/RNase